MKNTNLFAHKLFTGVIALVLIGAAAAASAKDAPQVVTVIHVEGSARYSSDNKTWNKLHRGDVLQPGSVIQTATGASVDILMGEEVNMSRAKPAFLGAGGAGGGGAPGEAPKANIIHVFESSVLAIDKLTVSKTGADEVSETQLDLRAGQILGNVKKLSAASRYEVKIPNGVAGIRGTVYMVSATGVVYVLEGSVVISYVNPAGQLVTATVGAGNSFNPFSGANGTTSPMTQAQITALTTAYNQLTGGVPSPQTATYNKNNTVINISAE